MSELTGDIPESPIFGQKYFDTIKKQEFMFLFNINNELSWLPIPAKKSVWAHIDKHTLYKIQSVTNLHVDQERYFEFPVMVNYIDTVTGYEWSRPLHHFLTRCIPHKKEETK